MDRIEIPKQDYFIGRAVDLRSMEPEDMAVVRSWINDERITAYQQSRLPTDAGSQESWFTRTREDASKLKLIIEAKEDGPVGMASLMKIDQKNKNCEVGVYVSSDAQKKGFAREALGLLLGFAFGEWNMRKVYAQILDFNVPSQRLFQSLGFVLEGTLKDDVFTNNQFRSTLLFALHADVYSQEGD